MATVNYKAFYYDIKSCERAKARLEKMGIFLRFERRLIEMTNQQWNGGRLVDALCHYANRYELSGNTYAIRDLLKKWGFTWDVGERVWWIAPKQGLQMSDITKRILKVVGKYEVQI